MVTDQASLAAAIQTANGETGDTIELLNSITLTSVLPNITSTVIFNPNSFTLTGASGSDLLTLAPTSPSNSLTLSAGGVFGATNASGVTLATDGTVTNNATLNGGGSGNAIYAAAGAAITNNGSLSSSVGSGYDAIFVTNNGSLANTGTITGDGAAVQFNGSATSVTNSVGATITGNTGSAIYIEGTGNVSNDGSLSSTNSSAVAILQGGEVTNTGSIAGTFGGVQLGSDSHPNGGTLTNSGTIQATMDGGNAVTIIGDGGLVTNQTGGIISSTLTAGSGSWGVDFEGANETLNNDGAIRGDTAVVFDGSGTLTNTANGNIAGTTTGVSSGAGGASGAVTITSAGQISGGTYAIQLTGAYDNTITLQAGSQTTGLISTGGGNDSVSLAGLSTGGVNLGAGDNTLTLVGGASAGGTLDGGTGGTNRLILTGTASGTVNASQLTDFSAVIKTGTGIWFVDGPSTLNAAWKIQQGTVQINDVTGVGAKAVLDNGALSLYGASGTFTNDVSGTGVIDVTAVGAGNTLTFTGNLTNTGATSIAGMVVFDASHVAVSGVNTSGAIGVAMQGDGGTLDVLSGGSINAGDAVYAAGANVTVNNSGTLVGHVQSGMYGTGVDLFGGGTLNNSGSITGDNIGVELGQAGTVNNLAGGTITGLNGNAIYAAAGATIVNNGVLTSTAGTGYDAVFVTTGGSLTNTGTITGDGAAVQFNGSATVTNSATGTITGNTGSAIFIEGTGNLTNDGTLTSTNSSAVAILQGGEVTNTGSISGTFGGVQLGSGSHPNGGTLTNSGTIQATVDGGNAVTIVGDGGVINNQAGGSIASTLTAGSGSWGVDFEGAGETLNNDGAVKGDTAVVFDGSGALVNTSTGNIAGTTAGVASGANGAVTITSAGQISGGTYAIELTGAFDNTITLQAGSTTTGLIATDTGNDSLTLAGTSTGGVNLGGGNNTLTLVTGASAGGTLDGGAGGTNALVLSGDASGSVGGAQLTDFATATKTGAGTWTLTGGASALNASWTVQQGVLSVANDAALGTGSLTIDGGAEFQATATTGGTRAVTIAGTGADIDVASGATYTLAGVVTGAAGTSLNINNGGGSGIVAFTTDNSATLASDINLHGGAVYAGVTGALGTGTIHVYDPDIIIASGVSVGNNVDLHSTLTVEQDSGSGGITGVISQSTAGSGLTKVGSGTLTLSAANTYTGATTISTGTLALTGAGSIASSSGVVDNGVLDVSNAAAGTAIKSLSGAGSVALGAQTLTLTNASGTFSGDISGTGGVTFAGGTETLTGESTYSGATTVSGGSLVLDGSLTNSTINVTNGGSLQGTGAITNVLIASGSALSPGGNAGFGQVNVAGNLTLAAGSTYKVTVNAAGQSDFVTAGGQANVAGSSVQVLARGGTYSLNTDYTILEAAGGVVGTFSGVTSNLAFLTPTLSYTGTTVDLNLLNNNVKFQDVAATWNQRSTAAALYKAGSTSTLYNDVLTQSTAGARQAFESLSGEMYATAPSVQLDESHYVRDALLGRLRQAGDQGLAGSGPAAGQMGSGDLKLTAWAQAVGAWSSVASEGAGNIASSQGSASGAIVGLDGQVKSWRVGAALAQLDTDLSVSELGSHDSGTSTHLAVYAGGPVTGQLQGRVGFDYAWNDMSSSRSVAFPGFTDQVGDHYQSNTEDAFAELGYAMRYGRVSLQPYANLAYVRVDTGTINEGGGLAALKVGSNDTHAVLSELGVRAATSFQLSPTLSVEPYATAAWRHAFGDSRSTAALTFDSTGTSFNVKGAGLDHNAADLEAGLTLNTNVGVKLTAAYVGELSDNWQDNQAKLAVAWSF